MLPETGSADATCRFGLKPSTLEKIFSVFSQATELEKAVLYGSRAKGNYRHGSDIDLTLSGEALDYAHLSRTNTQIDDLLLPYTVDLSLFKHIDNPELIDHIKRVGIVFYEKKR